MAKCEVCGRWAGFFRRFHDACAVKAERQAPAVVQPPGPIEASVGFAFGADFNRPQITISVNRPHRMIYIAQLHAVLAAAVAHAGIQDASHQVSAGIAAKLLQIVATSLAERDFIAWCKTQESGVNTSIAEWHRLFFWAGWALTFAEERAVQMWDDDDLAEVFPYLELVCFGCRIPAHATLDKFVAGRRDPVWQYLWPPNDWLCSCTIVCLMQSEGKIRPEAKTPGCQRVEEKLLNRALSWYQRSPRPVMKSVAEGA